MTTREGSLEAPTRHPLDWHDPQFYDEAALTKEMERVFDICHGCRRCVSLCQSFPTLFDLVDEGKTGEIDGVDKRDFWKVVDQCYMCDLCYMTKCPYVPPHPWNVDFPHLMLRGKAYKFRTQGASFRDRLLTGTDRLGKLASIPVVTQTINWANRTPATRKVLEKTLGVAKEAALPRYTSEPFRSTARKSLAWPVQDGQRTPGKVAIFTTCYVNYNEPGLARDLVAILEHNRVPFTFAEREACCGMPKLELGDLESIEKLKDVNIPALAALARDGYAILTPVPSCTLMFKQELPLIFPGDEDVNVVRDAMFDPFEYLALRDKDGLLRRDFKHPLGKISYHIPCHSRVQNVGQKTREVLEWVPGTEVSTVERCAGHDGTYGVKREFYEASMKIGKPVFNRMAEPDPDYISSDCPIAGRRITQGIRDKQPLRARTEHPAYAHQNGLRDRMSTNPADGVGSAAPLTRESLLTLEAYAKARKEFRARVIEHKRPRTVQLGNHVTLVFEDALTMRYQVQEMLYWEKTFDEAGIQDELDAYTPLVPDGTNLKATMLIEYEHVDERRAALERLKGVEDRAYVQVDGFERVYAIADEDLERENEVKTSAVHFLRFELTSDMIAALKRDVGLRMGVDHTVYRASVDVSAQTRASLARDFV